ncbi:MAG: type ISP restriction/modification enzyme [Phreatobacter sp.]|nr:type ISP restriction/modification enzyme [Phreatobacter sp.]
MSQMLVQAYLNEIDRIRRFSGVVNEQVIRPAFRRLLDDWSKAQKLVFLEEYPAVTSQKTTVYPDGTVQHDIRVPLGHWEAKDTADDLDEEIAKKLRRGYPQDNIIFENSHTAVLIQNRQEVMRCGMTDTAALLKLLTLFFGYERQEIAEFRKAVDKFKADLPAVLDALRAKIDEAYAANTPFRKAAEGFLKHARETINPAVSEADIREMLIQHILTEEIFTHVFDQGDFHRENNIAKELYGLEGRFFTGAVKRETLRGLEPYYATIRANAALISSHHEKQSFLKVIYENFYKVYNPKAADRLGVVYTPNEIVKFMIEGADWLCQKHFGKSLIDRDVDILDPATGTGTFICELLEHFRGQPDKLAHKYKSELHANEVAILPYYVANLNIEATYYGITGQYAEFPNLCFVDTLDNVAGLGIRAGYQHDMFAGLSDENVARVKRQNAKKISVIIGNPPYNANQANENDNNKNREYKRIDELIKSSYIRLSTAQKTKLYDMYARFFRWASDRLHDDGVIAFVTNSSFVNARTYDGFRKAVAQDFHEIYVVDLKGDARSSGEQRRREAGNVFDDQIRVGIAISFWVKKRKAKGCKIHYQAVPDYAASADKRHFLTATRLSERKFLLIEPDKKGNWLHLTDNDWDSLLPLADKKTKATKFSGQERAIFRAYSLGIVTNRDDWAYDFDRERLSQKIQVFSRIFNTEIEAWRKQGRPSDTSGTVSREIKWTSELELEMRREKPIVFKEDHLAQSSYRPFVSKWTYFAKPITHRPYQNVHIFPPGSQNRTILTVVEPRAGFSILVSGILPNKDFFMPSAAQHFPRYRYTPTGERIDNITDWGLKQFQARYGKAAGITRDAIFAYVYGVLHDPVYRETYAQNLKRDLPRIPLHDDFARWAAWGQELLDLHIGYETVEPFALTRTDVADERARAAGVAPKPILKSDHAAGIIRIDGETTLSGIPPVAFGYLLGNRAGLDWVLDQYREKTPKDPTIREKFNTYRFADYKEHVIDLLARVTTVSLRTVEIVAAMRALRERR